MWRIGAAIIVLIMTLIVARILSSRVNHALQRTTLGPNPTILLVRLTRVTIWLLGLLWILAIFSVPFTALAAVVGVTALAISLSLQDLLKNLIAGIYLLAERPFRIGDCITVSGVTGVIDDIQMRVTYLHTDEGEKIVMPNQTVFTQVIVNNTVGGSKVACLSLEAPRSMASDDLKKKALTAVADVPSLAIDRRPRLESVGVTPDTTKWSLYVWLKPQEGVSEVVLALGQALPEATIGPPPP